MLKFSKNIILVFLIFSIFVGCKNQKGDSEFNKAMKAKDKGDLVRSRSLLEKSFRKTIPQEKQAIIANELGIILWNLNDYEEANKYFKNATEKSSKYNKSALNYSVSLFHEKKIDDAEIIINNLIAEDPNEINAIAILGCINAEQKKWELAHNKINTALEKDPSNPVLKNIWIITKLFIDNDLDQTGWDLERLVEFYPRYLPARYNLAVFYDKWLSDSASAKIHYSYYVNNVSSDDIKLKLSEQAIKRIDTEIINNIAYPSDPNAAKLLEQKGAEAYKNKDYQDAINYFRSALEKVPEKVSLHYNMGLSFYEMNDFTTACDSFKKALRINKNYEDARYMLSVSYFQLRDYAQAEREARRLKAINDKRANVLLNYIESARN